MAPSGYADVERLALGRWTSLYRARRQSDGRPVLLEVLSPEHCDLDRAALLENQLQLAQGLESAFVLEPLGISTFEGQPALELEDIGGAPLDTMLSRAPGILALVELAVRVTAAVVALHARGVVHGGLAPRYIVVNGDTGAVKLFGFWHAQRIGRDGSVPRPTVRMEDSLPYLPPEQSGRLGYRVDRRSDLYALGVIFFELFTGQRPFDAKDTMGWLHGHLARKPAPPSEVAPSIPSALSSIVLKLLEKAPDERYQSAAGLLEDLRHCSAELDSTGALQPFSLGRADTSDAFVMPQKLYGRDDERAKLLDLFERAKNGGSPRLVLVSGAAGTGKSALVQELRAPCAAAEGRFVAGKFDPLARQVPYAAIIEALRELVLDLLTDSADRIVEYRSRISAKLGNSAALLCSLIPELGLILGSEPLGPELSSAETQKRLRVALYRFVAAFATREHPVLIFLDDVQWIDQASIDLLVDLLEDADVRSLFFACTCHEDELGSPHPLRQALDRLVTTGVAVDEIRLEPLSVTDVVQLISDLARVHSRDAESLARVVHEKTHGNPLFVVQLLSELHRRDLIVFEPVRGRWDWKLAAIVEEPCSENVTGLLLNRLRGLPADTQETLGVAAHIGRSFEAARLALVMLRDPTPTLEAAVAQGLLSLLGKRYQFPHDRVRDAAYALVSEGDRAATHLRIGRLLLGATPAERRDEQSFELAHHFNLAARLLTSEEERAEAAELDLRAGRRAQASAAHASAISYFSAGSALLGEDSWERRYDLAFALRRGEAESELARDDLGAAEKLLAALERRARGFVDRAAVACAQATLLARRSEFSQSLALLVDLLSQGGIDWRLDPSDETIRDEYGRLRASLADRPIESLLELGAADTVTQATMEVLIMVVEMATATNERLMRLAACTMANLSVERGHCDASPLAFVHLGQMAGPYFDDYQSGFRFARLGLNLHEVRRQPRFRERSLTMAGAFIYHWTQPFAQAIELLRRGFDATLENGEAMFAWLALRAEVSLRLFAGDPLADVERVSVRARELARKSKLGPFFQEMTWVAERLIRVLRGTTSKFPCFDDTDFEERRFEAGLASNHNLVLVEGWYWIRKLEARYYGGDYDAALAAAERAEALIWTTGFAIERVDYHLYRGLALAAHFDASPLQGRDKRRAALMECVRTLDARARDCTSNFGSCAALLRAELARIDGDERAAQHYEDAIRSAREHGLLSMLALGYETASAFYRGRGFGSIADAYLREAHGAYRRWGADGKARQLEQRSPMLAVHGGTQESPVLDLRSEQLDLLAVVKASQTISGVMFEEQVLDTLLHIVLEQGGARRARLILTDGRNDDGAAHVAAEASVEDAAPLLQPAPRVPTSMIDYVRRTGSLVVLEDAAKDPGRFAKDPYLARAHPRSVLCLPVRRHGTLLGILYLENDLAPGVFTADRLLALELLATQAAVSLQNAELLARERAAREEAQRDRRRALLLAEVTALLSDGGDRADLIEALRLVCNQGLADWAVLNTTQAGGARCVAHAHQDPLKEPLLLELSERYAGSFGATVLGARRAALSAPLLLASLSDEQVRSYSADDEHAALTRKLGLRSLLVVPLVARGAQVGLLFLMAAKPHHFQSADVSLGAELGQRLAMALEAARLAELENMLHQAQKMEAIGRLAGSVAHDFNNVLSVILACSQFASERFAPGDPGHEELEEIRKAAERATELTRRLLAFSRHRPVESGVIDVNWVVSELKNMLTTLVGSQVRLTVRPGERLWKTRADRVQLEQLLMNLAANARDAMPSGGTLLFETSNVELGETQTRRHLDLVPGQYVLLTVTDTGCGMDPEVKARIFEPFFTTKKPGEGTGLGLATVFGIVRQCGGHVSVESEIGRGTTFGIYLPRCTAAEDETAPRAPAPSEASLRGSETILLVEDDEQVRNTTRAILQHHGYTVLDAAGPGDALLICEQFAGTIDLLLSDIVMPHMSGPELAERIIVARPTIRLLFMSGYTDTPLRRQALGDYRVEFLQKPFTPQTMAASVRKVLDLPDAGGARHSGRR